MCWIVLRIVWIALDRVPDRVGSVWSHWALRWNAGDGYGLIGRSDGMRLALVRAPRQASNGTGEHAGTLLVRPGVFTLVCRASRVSGDQPITDPTGPRCRDGTPGTPVPSVHPSIHRVADCVVDPDGGTYERTRSRRRRLRARRIQTGRAYERF